MAIDHSRLDGQAADLHNPELCVGGQADIEELFHTIVHFIFLSRPVGALFIHHDRDIGERDASGNDLAHSSLRDLVFQSGRLAGGAVGLTNGTANAVDQRLVGCRLGCHFFQPGMRVNLHFVARGIDGDVTDAGLAGLDQWNRS